MVKKSLFGLAAVVALGLLVPAFGADTGDAPKLSESSTKAPTATDPKGTDAKISAAEEAKKSAKAKRLERRQNRAATKPKTHQ